MASALFRYLTSHPLTSISEHKFWSHQTIYLQDLRIRVEQSAFSLLPPNSRVEGHHPIVTLNSAVSSGIRTPDRFPYRSPSNYSRVKAKETKLTNGGSVSNAEEFIVTPILCNTNEHHFNFPTSLLRLCCKEANPPRSSCAKTNLNECPGKHNSKRLLWT